jgi:hypothetical protein
MRAALRAQVIRRAKGRCEYCKVPQAADPNTFEIEHVIARQHKGPTQVDNLAVACASCNRFKGPNLSGIDPSSQQVVQLFHPRRDRWSEHFRASGPMIVGITPTGRATVEVLQVNSVLRIALRTTLLAEGTWPPVMPDLDS